MLTGRCFTRLCMGTISASITAVVCGYKVGKVVLELKVHGDVAFPEKTDIDIYIYQ